MNFHLSQLILIVAIVLFIVYIFRVRTVLTDRIIYLALVLGGILFVIYPDLSTRAANMIGIGRGADLILYIFVIFSLFNHAILVSRIKSTERQLTMIVRRTAINNALADPLSRRGDYGSS